MGRKGRPRLRALADELARRHPEIDDPERLIRAGGVLVRGLVVANPRSLVLPGSVSLRRERPLRGEAKLRAALDAFGVAVAGRTALDVGAAAGGFTRVLLEKGARRVYAVDAGHGQLLGSLRADPRVVDLEATNLADVAIGEPIELVTIDVSYLALATAAPQLERVPLAPQAELIALVKPQFELGLREPPRDPAPAVARAAAGFAAYGWEVLGAIESPVRGARGSVEFLLSARRSRSRPPEEA
jgi:23S rRNA (cytidine1920-2'-O)/16S rRNA (cytidine1409-2'-O)-methyltransferase